MARGEGKLEWRGKWETRVQDGNTFKVKKDVLNPSVMGITFLPRVMGTTIRLYWHQERSMEVTRLMTRDCTILIPHMIFWTCIKSTNNNKNEYETRPVLKGVKMTMRCWEGWRKKTQTVWRRAITGGYHGGWQIKAERFGRLKEGWERVDHNKCVGGWRQVKGRLWEGEDRWE